MSAAQFVRVTERGFKFTWHGGSYIDVSKGSRAPFDVLNVSGQPEQPFTRIGLLAHLDDWQSGFDSATEAFRYLADCERASR